MKFHSSLIAAAVATICAVGSAQADVVVLNFEGINATYPSGFANINGYYNGGTSSDGTSGANYGVEFTSNALAICLNTPGVVCSNTSRGGVAPGSELGGLFWLDGPATYMNYAAGFEEGFSFNYAAPNTPGSVSVYDGLNGTGNLLATLDLGLTPRDMRLGIQRALLPVRRGRRELRWCGEVDLVRRDGQLHRVRRCDVR